jgi:thiamine-phosphate pyrophosphorylase
MKRRQTMPRQWLIADHRLGEQLWPIARRLPTGAGVLILYQDLGRGERARVFRRLRRLPRRLAIADEAIGGAVRVHNLRELRRALLARTPMILLSPLYHTPSHPDWLPLQRMRAAALARLAGRNVIALGGMDARRFSRIERLGFQAWAGISAFRT